MSHLSVFLRATKISQKLKGENRKQLITVPSCKEHNTNKSGDDEFLRLVITQHYANNPTARQIVQGPIKRSIARNPKVISDNLKDFRLVTDNPLVEGSVLIEEERIERALDYFARGLYFHEFKAKWLTNDLWVHQKFLQIRDHPIYSQYNEKMFEIVNQRFLNGQTRKGSNPEVFFYRIYSMEDFVLIQAVFYDAVFINLSFGIQKYRKQNQVGEKKQ